MKILIPTDFSKLSKVAALYAARLAKKLDAEIVLLHVLFITGPGRSQTLVKTQEILDVMRKTSEMEFSKLLKELKKEAGPKIKITHAIREGYPMEDVVARFSRRNGIDFIVMGTKGASGLKRVVMGSNTTAVIGNSRIPLITVPEHARFNNIKNIVYASDMLAVKKEISTLIAFAQLFNAAIHILHIVTPDEKIKISKQKISKELTAKFDYPQMYFHMMESDNVIESIDDFVADKKADLLAMFTHTPTFFEKIFNRSMTRKMAFHSWIPLLAIKKAL